MDPERWKQIEHIYHRALEREQSQRSAFLQETCGGDSALRQEVESLLAHEQEAEDFIEAPALEVAAKGLAKDQVDSMIGRLLGSYKILSLLGAGGMGEVFLAQDTTLDRKVALKFLPEELQQDSTARKRFLREAKSAAALDHPYICHIHEVGEIEGKSFISMEYVQGETLKEKLVEGPLPLKEALEKAQEIAEALEEAHKQGIVHRDVKPDNIMLTPQGHVKVMDFGLAKWVTTVEGQEQEITTVLTKQGSTLGTVPYMSPEQVRGQEVDTRSDIFSFGVVLYEMLTGVNPFKGDTSVDTSHAILGETPSPLTRYTENIPVLLQHTVRKMLAKEPDSRYQLIHDVRTDLGELMDEIEKAWVEPTTVSPIGQTLEGQPGRWGRTLTLGLVALAGVALGVAIWSLMRPPLLPPSPLRRLVIQLPSLAPLEVEAGHPAVAISPDGTRLVYVANNGGKRQLYLRRMDQLEATAIPGTEGGYGPFFSPDGQSVGFAVGTKLKKVPLSGGAPQILGLVPPITRGASWGPDDTIIFTADPNQGLSRIPTVGNTLPDDAFSDAPSVPWVGQILTIPDPTKGEYSHRWAQFLPGGKAVLFTIDTGGSFDEARIAVLSLETGKTDVLFDGGTNPRYSPTGHIVFCRAGALLAMPFDLERLERTGDPVTVVEGILMDPRGAAHFTFSDDGSLVYVSGDMLILDRKLVWVNRQGEVEPLPAEPREYMNPSLSADGRRVAVATREGSNYDVWVSDAARGTLTRLTSQPGEDHAPIWTPDGKQVTFASDIAGEGPVLWWRPADRSGPQEQLLENEGPLAGMPTSWSPDGQTLAFTDLLDPVTGTGDIRMLSLEDEQELWAFLETKFDESGAMFSPNGRWLAYMSNETGRDEIYVQPFNLTGPRGTKQISVSGGTEPLWAPDGRELFYRNGDKMMAVAIETEPELSVGTPRLLFEGRFLPGPPWARRNYDISPDGQRFLMIQREEDLVPTEIIVVLNWFEELKRLVPTN